MSGWLRRGWRKLTRRDQWFRLETPTGEVLAGRVNSQGVDFYMRSGWDEIRAQVPAEQVDKLVDWLLTVRPRSTRNNVIEIQNIRRIPSTLPVSYTPADSGRSPGSNEPEVE